MSQQQTKPEQDQQVILDNLINQLDDLFLGEFPRDQYELSRPVMPQSHHQNRLCQCHQQTPYYQQQQQCMSYQQQEPMSYQYYQMPYQYHPCQQQHVPFIFQHQQTANDHEQTMQFIQQLVQQQRQDWLFIIHQQRQDLLFINHQQQIMHQNEMGFLLYHQRMTHFFYQQLIQQIIQQDR
jgi:hypothetical protein